VRIVVGYAPGGAGVTALTGQLLSERLGQQFVVENRPGAGTNITEAVVRAPADSLAPPGLGSERDQCHAL
jgi:tripartite-type tricarboxylate transporter receptor subunit TctC